MPAHDAAEDEGIADGRVRRGARNREAIVGALFDLVGEGELQPTAEQVAERAGVQVRTVFRHFEDMASLHAEMSSRLKAQIRPVFEDVLRTGSLADRARSLVQARALIFERIAPYKRAANTHRWRLEHLQRDHESMVRETRKDLLDTFPELENASASAVAALDLVSSFEAWDRLRSDQRLGIERARAVMETAVFSLLGTL